MAEKKPDQEIHDQHEKETLEFERIQAELEKYGLIMQACIEEAEKTIKMWRGNPEVCLWNEEFWRMIPGISFAFFEKVTGKSAVRDLMLLFTMQSMTPLAQKIIEWNTEKFWQQTEKFWQQTESDDKGEGAEP